MVYLYKYISDTKARLEQQKQDRRWCYLTTLPYNTYKKEKFKATKETIGSRNSKEETPQWPKVQTTITQKTKDRATRTPLKSEMNSCAPEG